MIPFSPDRSTTWCLRSCQRAYTQKWIRWHRCQNTRAPYGNPISSSSQASAVSDLTILAPSQAVFWHFRSREQQPVASLWCLSHHRWYLSTTKWTVLSLWNNVEWHLLLTLCEVIMTGNLCLSTIHTSHFDLLWSYLLSESEECGEVLLLEEESF